MPSRPPRRKLTSHVILGSWGLGDSLVSHGRALGYSGITAQTAHSVLDSAFEAGIGWIDLALGYGGGTALERYAKWSDHSGKGFRTALKIGRPYVDGVPTSQLDWSSLSGEVARAAALIGSPDAILIKDPPKVAFADGTVQDHILWLQQSYPDCRIGLVTHNMEIAKWLLPLSLKRPIIAVEFNLARAREALPMAEALDGAGWSVWGMQPLAFGFLAGRKVDGYFASDDFRARLPIETRRALQAIGRRFWQDVIAFRNDVSAAECALAFCFCQTSLSSTVVGPKSTVQWTSVEKAWLLAAEPEFQDIALHYVERT